MGTLKWVLCFFIITILTGCGSMVRITGSKMNELELGMSKKQVTDILGKEYTIAEKRKEGNNTVEVLSYRDFYNDDEFYMFLFVDDELEKWYRELLPKYETVKQ